MLRAYAHVADRKVNLRKTETTKPGETFIGTIDLSEKPTTSPEAYQNSQVIFHYVEELMIKAKLLGYPGYQIVLEEEEAPVEP